MTVIYHISSLRGVQEHDLMHTGMRIKRHLPSLPRHVHLFVQA